MECSPQQVYLPLEWTSVSRHSTLMAVLLRSVRSANFWRLLSCNWLLWFNQLTCLWSHQLYNVIIKHSLFSFRFGIQLVKSASGPSRRAIIVVPMPLYWFMISVQQLLLEIFLNGCLRLTAMLVKGSKRSSSVTKVIGRTEKLTLLTDNSLLKRTRCPSWKHQPKVPVTLTNFLSN